MRKSVFTAVVFGVLSLAAIQPATSYAGQPLRTGQVNVELIDGGHDYDHGRFELGRYVALDAYRGWHVDYIDVIVIGRTGGATIKAVVDGAKLYDTKLPVVVGAYQSYRLYPHKGRNMIGRDIFNMELEATGNVGVLEATVMVSRF